MGIKNIIKKIESTHHLLVCEEFKRCRWGDQQEGVEDKEPTLSPNEGRDQVVVR